MTKLETQIPFDGFYNSVYSGLMDDVVQQEAEHHIEQNPSLQGREDEIWDAYDDNFQYSDAQEVICKAYVDAFSGELGITLTYKEMTSPAYYNFETDKIYCTIDLKDAEKMFKASAGENHKTLTRVIHDRHTSYSGFVSFYSNDLDDWLNKPVKDWDCNELCTLIIAYGLIYGAEIDDSNLSLYYRVADIYGNGELYLFDYDKIEAQVNQLKEKETENA